MSDKPNYKIDQHLKALQKCEDAAWDECLPEMVIMASDAIRAVSLLFSDDQKKDLADSAVYALYIKLEAGKASFVEASKFRTYLMRTARNLAVSKMKRDSKHVSMEATGTVSGADGEPASAEFVDVQSDESRAQCDRENAAMLAFSQLSSDCKELITARYQQEMKQREISEKLHIPMGSLTSRTNDCRERLEDFYKTIAASERPHQGVDQ
jgi:RNA polymerase sigma factor (sigma-70 family)